MVDNHAAWHDRSAETTLQGLKTTPVGLSEVEAEARLKTYGANRLPEAKKRSVFVRFLLQFHNILIYVLIGSAAITAFLDHLSVVRTFGATRGVD